MLYKRHIITNFPKDYPFYKKVWANLLYFMGTTVIHHRENLLNEADIKKSFRTLKRGDVVLVGSLRYLSKFILGNTVTHAMLYIGNKTFIHAIPDGVKYLPLHKAVTEFDTMVVLRLPKIVHRSIIINRAIKYARSQINLPFDFEFKDDQRKFFCSELVDDAYLLAGYNTGLKVVNNHKPLHAVDYMKSRLDLVFLSHNLEYKKKVLKYKNADKERKK